MLMGAFPEQRQPVMKARVAEGVHDPLWARALALSDGTTTITICVADVALFRWCDVDRIRAAFAQETELSPDSLIVAGTHNHNGPECLYMFGGSPDHPYIGDLTRLTAAAAADAVSGLAPARIGAASMEADLAYNRREISPTGVFRQANANPEGQRRGPVDPRVSLLRVEYVDGTPMTAAFHFAAHPVIMTWPNHLFTAGYPGEAVNRFESLTGLPLAMFWQGAGGDTHPYEALTDDWAQVAHMGTALAETAAAAYVRCMTGDDVELAVARWKVEVPHRYSESHKVRVEVTVIRLTDRLALVFWPGEPYIELSLALQWRSPFAMTIVMGYSAGCVGYVPPRNAYEFGGYGVDLYEQDSPEYSRTSVRPGFGERLVNETARLLEELKNDHPSPDLGVQSPPASQK